MSKLTIGRSRTVRESRRSRDTAADVPPTTSTTASSGLMLGQTVVCVALAVSMLYVPPKTSNETVTVMSSAVVGECEREELERPSSAEVEEWSFYDYIGELFAGLISGNG